MYLFHCERGNSAINSNFLRSWVWRPWPPGLYFKWVLLWQLKHFENGLAWEIMGSCWTQPNQQLQDFQWLVSKNTSLWKSRPFPNFKKCEHGCLHAQAHEWSSKINNPTSWLSQENNLTAEINSGSLVVFASHMGVMFTESWKMWCMFF